jgi:hypothetical protein
MSFPSTHNATEWMNLTESAIRALTPAGGGEVRYRDVVSHIESIPGFPGWDAWGMRPHKGGEQPKALRAVTLAAGKLKDAGVIAQPRRGYYLLVQDAQTMTTPTPEPTPAPVKATVTRTSPVVTEAGVQYIPPTVTAVDGGYGDDAGLRRMAVEGTRCFGSWSTRSDQCDACPLAALCQQAGMADFAEVAAALDAETEAALAANAAQPAPAPAPAPESGGAVSFAGNDVTTPFDVHCTVCKGMIPSGSPIAHAVGVGPVHPGCKPA